MAKLGRMPSAPPLVIEAAINGSTSKAANPNVPRTVEEIVASAIACVEAGASIVHNHNDEPNFGQPSRHSPDPYERAWREVWTHYPGLLMVPTTSMERSAPVEERFAHLDELHRRGALTMAIADPGSFSAALAGPSGPIALPAIGNSATEVAWIFGWAQERDIPLHISIWEPGFLRLTLAHLLAGTLPRRTKVQLYFSGENAYFGLPAKPSSIATYLGMLAGTGLPWMVAALWGDVFETGVAQYAIDHGGHLRVGLEDYAGPGQPTNEQLVTRAVELAELAGREVAGPSDAREVLWGR